ncbi:hypothetical protein [Paucisalibacillus globulus]|uniref:hypothetical protein n=1 Tax=Paucisalibacillus globulus TaxID=351095 RepID=UPI000479D111|nr:hypothetical protein [Paucisalibacillus globulus]
MSWKSVEMQVALPRTVDAGKLQEQSLKQNQHFQETLAQNQLVQEQIKRKRVQEFEETQLQKDKLKRPLNRDDNTSKEQKNEDIAHINHPFLGNNFDGRS